ncbi:MAG TPA: hypothetical protein VMB81_14155, partial [Candidatus Sulfotelmatobacter sp.]|nr:hypothetical protein [Candidatus Sulfotelmatobacter sp.]
MYAVDVDSELAKAGAHARGGWGQLRFFVRRYPLGAIGAALMALFVFAAVFADVITVYSPLSTNAAIS